MMKMPMIRVPIYYPYHGYIPYSLSLQEGKGAAVVVLLLLFIVLSIFVMEYGDYNNLPRIKRVGKAALLLLLGFSFGIAIISLLYIIFLK